MKQHSTGYISNRVLKLNVGFILAAGSGYYHDVSFDTPTIRVADDLDLQYIRGEMRLSRTKEGILAQGNFNVGLQEECYRCLDLSTHDLILEIEELFAYPANRTEEFGLTDDAVMDLSPLIRAETLIMVSSGVLCKEDCKGLCPECGANMNTAPCRCAEGAIDPRLAAWKALLEAQEN